MIIAILLVLGLCLGSFINALVFRLHEKQRLAVRGKRLANSRQQLSIWRGRSICPNCKHQLSALDLVPLVSWLALRGKCRYCRKPISWQYPLVEALTAFTFIFSYLYWPFVFDGMGITLFIFWLIFLVGLVALAIYDMRWFTLPDKIVYPLMVLALAQAVILLAFGPLGSTALALAASFLVGGGLFYLIFQISNGRWIGGGDVKLGALLGLILADGGLMTLTIFLASILGTIVALPLLATGRASRTTKLPFGPFLIVAAVIARLFGSALIHWYHQKLLGS